MKNILPARIKNKFEFELKDAKTGKVRQKATSYNVVLDSYFTALVNGSVILSYIHVGNGSGTPAPSDTALFGFRSAVSSSIIKTVREYPISSCTRSITITPDQLNGQITEVGLGGSASNSIRTHSMLQDSEGNPIVINKTNSDVLTITSTIYVTITQSGSAVFPMPENNLIVSTALGVSAGAYSTPNIIYSSTHADTAELVCNSGIRFVNATRSSDQVNKRWVYSAARLEYTHGNFNNGGLGVMVKSIGNPCICAWNLPDPQIFPSTQFNNLAVGIGDGVTLNFDAPVPECVEGSQKIYANGILQTPNVDYTFIRFSKNKFLQALESCTTKPIIQYNFTAIRNSTNAPPVYPIKTYSGVIDPSGSTCGVSADSVFYDFGTPIEVNGYYNNDYYSSLKAYLQYSVDNITWVTAATIASASTSWRSISPITARYWRLKSTSTPESPMGLSCHYYADGVGDYGFCFGKKESNIKFAVPPAAGAAITMNCAIDKPFKNANWIMDFSFSVQFERG